MKKKISFILSLVGTACIMMLIYWFSGQPSTQSHGYSRSLTVWLLDFFTKLHINGLSVPKFEHFLRKSAHFGLYFTLGFFLSGATQKKGKFFTFAFVMLIGVIFAALDEFHQCFSQARSPLFWDVIIDTCGIATGSLLRIWKREK